MDFSVPICRLCLNTDSTFTTVQPSEQLFMDIFELIQIQILDIPGIPSAVVCDSCKSNVETFIEFKKTCISSNDRLINQELMKLEIEPYKLWCQDHDNRETKPFIDEPDRRFVEQVNVPTDNILNVEKSSMKKAKPERDVCSYCGKTFLFLSQHIKYMHSGATTNVKRFTCGLCFEKFTEIYLAINNVSVCCVTYQFFIISRTLFKIHIDSSHDGKMFQCDICGKRDKSLGGLTRHIRSHSKIRPYSCELCGKLFRYSKSLFEHKLRHANNRRFKCEICEKRFFTHTEISSHRLIHSKDRSFKCKTCGKGFKRPDHVMSHMRIHLKDKIFPCQICEKEFSYKHNMVFHLKNVHGTCE